LYSLLSILFRSLCMQFIIVLFGSILLSSCNGSTLHQQKKEKSPVIYHTQHKVNEHGEDSLPRMKMEKAMSVFGLVNVQQLNPDIRVDIKYSSSDNFMKIILYERIRWAFLQKDVAERLAKCQKYLSSIDTSLHLLIYDAVRPLSVQWKMWNALDSIPPKRRVLFVSNPINRSIHNYGAAVDLTICTSNGTILDMGAGYDDIRKIAYPSLEKQFIASGELSSEHIRNRDLLRKVMKAGNFRQLPSEWWHFNACKREMAAKRYQLLEEEP
jgi:D-alanyl-D-alanine dipeptidase